ncbi:MAG: ribosome-associated protein [Actinomycetota bacterium]|nr:ribosome-associated protein [Actinomycetota bacterium]
MISLPSWSPADMAREGIRVNRSLVIPPDELRFNFVTSGGPGGQHANKTATRAELNWNVEQSRALGPRQRERIRTRLANRIDSSGNLRIVSDRYRSQMRNRQDVTERLTRLVAGALRTPRSRVATAPTKSSKEKRLRTKRHRSEIKRNRRGTRDLEGDG